MVIISPKDIIPKNEIHITCECGSEVMKISRDTYTSNDETVSIKFNSISQWNFSIWRQSFEPKTFWNRLKYCAYIMYHKKYFHDEIILSKEKVKELRDYLTSELRKTK